MERFIPACFSGSIFIDKEQKLVEIYFYSSDKPNENYLIAVIPMSYKTFKHFSTNILSKFLMENSDILKE